MRITVSTTEHYNTGPYESLELHAVVEADIHDPLSVTPANLKGYLDRMLAPHRDRVREVSRNNTSMIFQPAFESTTDD